MHRTLAALLLVAAAPLAAAAEPAHGGPVIDMHLHALAMDEMPPGAPACPGDQRVLVPTIDPREPLDFASFVTCEAPMLAARDDVDLRDGSLAALRRHNVRRAVTDGAVERVADWRAAAGGERILPAVAFGTGIRSCASTSCITPRRWSTR